METQLVYAHLDIFYDVLSRMAEVEANANAQVSVVCCNWWVCVCMCVSEICGVFLCVHMCVCMICVSVFVCVCACVCVCVCVSLICVGVCDLCECILVTIDELGKALRALKRWGAIQKLIIIIIGGGFFLACEDFGRMFNHLFSDCAFFFF